MSWGWWLLFALVVSVAALRAWPQRALERCSDCGHRRGTHGPGNDEQDGYCLRADCACEEYQA